MMSQVYEEIEKALAAGVQPQYIGAQLIQQGWPAQMVNEAVTAYLNAHGRVQKKTDFQAWLKTYKQRAFGALIVMVTVSVLSSGVLLLQPWPTKILVDSGFGTIQAPGPLAPYTHKPIMILITSLLTIVIFLVGMALGTARDYLILKLGFRLNRGIKEESFRHILHLPLFHQERLAQGDYIYRQNNLTDSLSDLVLDTTSLIAESVIMIVGILIIMLKFNLKLTAISVILVPFLFLLVRLFGPKLGKISREMTQVNSDTSAMVTESVESAETIQAFTLEEKQVGKANQLWWKNYFLSRSGLLWGRFYRFSNSLLIIMGTSAVMYFGGIDALHGNMTLGQLLIFMTYMGYLLGPVESIATEYAARNQKLVQVSRIYEVMADHEGIENLRKDNHFHVSKGRIEFQNVSYSAGDVKILDRINLIVEPGQKIAIIGPSGSGKSTLLKLLPLFIEPASGRILIDGIDIQSVSLQELRQKIIWISQNPQLFKGTILENLMDGDPNRQITQEEVNKAMAAANVNEIIDRLPLGLNSPTGEGGSSLSGGQRQRIAIARGLIKNAPIVCMDEPTAALDAKSENKIRDSISQLIAGKTVFMVTHRKALLSLMDKIFVMDSGTLQPVQRYGGLDAYLQKISDTEAFVEKARQQEMEKKMKEMVAQLESQKTQLQEQIETLSQGQPTPPGTDGGTIYISHS